METEGGEKLRTGEGAIGGTRYFSDGHSCRGREPA
jgi:hypothetical protein